jgi:hypothetical protein
MMSNESDLRQQAFQQAGQEMYEEYLRERREMEAYHEEERREMEQTIREQGLDEERANLLRRSMRANHKLKLDGLDRETEDKILGKRSSRVNQKAREKIKQQENQRPSDRELLEDHIVQLEKKRADWKKNSERRKENLVAKLKEHNVDENDIQKEVQRADSRAQKVLDTRQAEIEKAKETRDRWERLSEEERNRYLQRIDRENERGGWSR